MVSLPVDLQEFSKAMRQKERNDSLRFWLSIFIMIIGVFIALASLFKTTEYISIKQEQAKQAVELQELSNELELLKYNIATINQTLDSLFAKTVQDTLKDK